MNADKIGSVKRCCCKQQDNNFNIAQLQGIKAMSLKHKNSSEQSSQYNSTHLHGEQPSPVLQIQHKQSMKEEMTNVIDAKQKLDHMIEDLNDKLVTHFKMKQQALLEQYKKELVEQQKKLNELKNTTNQQQIRAKMLERKAQLEKERNELIQTNMFFSQKCEQYKQTYTKLVQQSKDLEKQIQFLDSQIAAANQKKLNLTEEATSLAQTDRNAENIDAYTQQKSKLPELGLVTEKKEQSTLQKSKNTQSVRKIAKSLHVETQQKPKKSNSTKGFHTINKGVFNKSPLEKIFEQCVEEVKGRRKSKRTMPILKGEQFTEYEKRAIMEIFLGNEDVKRKLYEIIFSENERNFKRGIPKDMQKTKINFDEIGM